MDTHPASGTRIQTPNVPIRSKYDVYFAFFVKFLSCLQNLVGFPHPASDVINCLQAFEFCLLKPVRVIITLTYFFKPLSLFRLDLQRPSLPGLETAMASFSTNEFRSGLKIMINGDPHNIVANEFVKPGKGQAFNRVRVRNLKTGRVVEKTFKSGESVEAADVFETDVQYLYNDGEFWHFMHPESYEQYAISKDAMADATYWMQEESVCSLTLFNGEPLYVLPPNFVEMRIIETDPGVRGDTSGGGGKPAKLESGATVRVPLFIQNEEVIKVDTRTGEYVSRVKG